MKKLLALISILWLQLTFPASSVLAYEETVPRYALVIGNAAYKFSPLKNPANDARDVAALLSELDYKVTEALDLDPADMLDTVTEFYREIESRDAISIFYYAGHAVQMENINYLLPVNSGIYDVLTLRENALSLSQLLSAIKRSPAEQNIIILDACRNNPFGSGTGDARIKSLGGGLAPVEAPADTLVAYATEPGNVASDGKGENGTYTAALLQHMAESIPAEELFKKVRKDVIRETDSKQIPWEHSSLIRKFYFGPPVNEEISDIVSF